MSASRTRKADRRRPRAVRKAASAKTGPSLSLSIQLGEGIDALPASRAQLRRWVAAAIDADATLTLRFVGRTEARMLNREYRGRDYATNVLTFAYEMPAGATGAPAGAAQAAPVQADIVVCVPVLEREASERRMPLAHHLAHLVVHGVLHACGHDHEHDDEAQAMEAREVELLARFRIPDPYRA
ncbi:rRNA maturation RNase YbeY [Burkholderiaceae bacterium FT117]|uniref:rRNA maturation RNase YbeY n=1 Tax=Zeimonas sediminis TaxID=2944268 RepID=UPI002342E293|nr:rRNA maturation RNase YbeY [Zeimonas sediminis]MCM5570284.1 rRNA maturation RNase YbeY [Zeimonas sediminis]